MNRNPLISIGIPTYNSAATIQNTLESILRQTYTNLEINVVDDKSKDNTLEIVKQIQNKCLQNGDGRIKIYENEKNLGMSGNWTKCLSVAKGEFVKLVCADDMMDEDALEKEVKAMAEHPTVNLVESDTRLVNIEGKVTGKFRRYWKSGVVDGTKAARTSIIWNNFFGAPVNNLIRKSVLDKVGYFDPEFIYILDFEMWMRIACEGDIYIIHEILNSFTVRNDSNTGNLIGKDRKTYVGEHKKLVYKYKEALRLSRLECKFSIFFRKFRNVAIGIYLKIFSK